MLFVRSLLLLVALALGQDGSQHAAGAKDAPVATEALEQATTALDKGDYATVLPPLRELADQGNARAQFKLGKLYDDGQGVAQSDAEALKWYRLSAEQGDADAEYNLAVMLDRGQGVPTNGAEALKWYMEAAEQGYAPVQNNLGLEYEDVRAVPQDYDEAVKWFRKSARSEAMPLPN
jgi:TPR repeat protein